MLKGLKSCELCPHRCKVNRLEGKIGRCKAGKNVKIALASVHEFEEPCISGKNGSGTIFFSNCNLSCKFCQNYEISGEGYGKEITVEELANIFIKQQEKGVNNINLVTPTMYVYHIIEAIKIAKEKGLKIPIIYNTNGYENVETIKMLKGYIDVYLPDFKYYNNEIAKKYSGIENYYEITSKAIKEMIRHLILPNYMQNTKNVLKYIKENIGKDTYVSVMAQYFPTYKAKQDEKLNRKINIKEYKEIEKHIYMLGLNNGYMQDLGKHEEEYVPNFKEEKYESTI